MLDLDNLQFWLFSQPVTETSDIECEDCQTYSPVLEWTRGEAGCEDCGTHDAIICPKCGSALDHVYTKTLNVKETK